VMGRGSSGHEGLYIGDIVKIDGTEVTIEIKIKTITSHWKKVTE
ncbi:hypothetical protein OBE_10620, partial [human gut metagenome]